MSQITRLYRPILTESQPANLNWIRNSKNACVLCIAVSLKLKAITILLSLLRDLESREAASGF